MLDFMDSIFPPGPRTEPRKPGLRQRFGCRNELDLRTSHLQVKNRVRFEFESSPLLQNDEIEKKGGIKLKIVMRKETASRLLLKCKNGKILDYEDVVEDLETIPGSYVRVISYNAKYE